MRTTLSTLGAVLLAGAAVAGAPVHASATSGPCGLLTSNPSAPPRYAHVVIIMEENLSYTQFNQSTQATYLHGLASACGSEAFMHAATHYSQPNYMAATSGVASAAGVKTSNNNIFHQAQVASQTWASYEESMPSSCTSTSGDYLGGHNPAYWYTDLTSPVNTCKADDVPMSPALDNAITNDALPTFGWVTPNACHDMHWNSDCPTGSAQRVAAGDQWIGKLVPRLTGLPSYQAGHDLIVVTWDEGGGASTEGDCTDPAVYQAQASCQIPTIVVSPYIKAGSVDHTDLNLYSLLGTTEDLLGYPRLGRAVGQASLRTGLGF